MDVGKIWDGVKEEGDAEYAAADPDFKAKLGHAASEARQGRSTGIAGLEKFEAAVAKDASATLSQSGVDAARLDPTGPTAVGDQPEPEDTDAETASDGEDKALKDAAAAGERVEASETHSPSAPSAARPMAAEAPGNKAGTTKKASAKKTATKTAAKKTGVKKAGKKTAK